MPDQNDWDAATWEGSRRAQLRRSLRLSVRERLAALEDLTETSEALAQTARTDQAGSHTDDGRQGPAPGA